MARTRAQRRRHSLFLTIALVATLIVLVFARDVSRSAHGALTNQRSENRSFAGLANTLIVQQNDFDARMARLLRSGATLARPVFDARLDQLGQQLSSFSGAAELLRRPKLSHDVNDEIADITESRIDDYDEIFAKITNALTLPAASPGPGTAVADPSHALIESGIAWNKDRFALRHEPGRVRLDSLTSSSAQVFAASGVTTLTASPSLTVVRGIGIAAVSVLPAPLPARRGVLVLPPVTEIRLGVSVVNTGFVEQSLTLRVVMTPKNGPLPPQRKTFHVVLAPLQSYAFVAQEIAVVPSERATLDLRISGAPASVNLTRSRSYRVEMSPPGAPPPG